MGQSDNYWMRRLAARRASRRSFVAGAATAGLGAAALALAGCGDDDGADGDGASPGGSPTTAAGEQPVAGGTLRLGTFLNVLGIDPHIETSVGLNTDARVYGYLAGFSMTDQKFNLLVAETLEQPSDTEFIFRLRKGVKFQDIAPVSGRELIAEDVKYSLERFRDLPQATNNDFFKITVDKMEVVDPYTFRVTTKYPYAESLSEIGGIQKAILAREDVEKRGDLSNGGVGSGPYMIDEYVKGELTVLKKNPNYWNKSVAHVDKISTQTILDMTTLFQAYKQDQLDINGALLTKLDYQELTGNNKLVNEKFPALHFGSLGLNASEKPFSDPRVRQAIYIGMDRGQFIDKVFQGEAVPMGPLSAGLDYWALSQDELKPYVTQDIKKAKELLTAAGYPDGFDMDVATSNGVQLYIDHAEVMVSELKKIGINASLKLTDLSTYLSTQLFTGNFHSTIFTHNPYESPKIPLGFYHKLGLGSGSWWHYDNPKVTEAVDKQIGEMDVQKRKQLVVEAQKLILDDWAPMLNFASPTAFTSYNKRVGGFDPKLRTWQVWRYSEYLRQV
jgi:ABC-type transport system substrate-binding protein